MAYPEPSINDHNAPWNEDWVEDEDGEMVCVCTCSACQQTKKKEAKQERLIDDYEYRKGGGDW